MPKNKKYVTLPDVRVSYSKSDGTVHLTVKDPSFPEGFNLVLPRGSKAETQMKVLLRKNEILTDLPESDLPLTVKLPLLKDIKWNLLPLGVGQKNLPIVWDVTQESSILIAGLPGSGKTVLMENLLKHVNQFPAWEPFVFSPTEPGQDIHTLLADLKDIESDMDSTYLRMKDSNVSHIDELNLNYKAKLIVIDEIWPLAPKDLRYATQREIIEAPAAAEALVIIGNLLRKGRAAGLYVIISTQSPDNQIIPLEMRTNLSIRVAMGFLNAQQSHIVFDKNIASQNVWSAAGRGFISKADYAGQFQAYTPN